MTDEFIDDKYKNLFNSLLGEEVLDHLKETFYYNHRTYRPGESAYDAIFREGGRTVILSIIEKLKTEVK